MRRRHSFSASSSEYEDLELLKKSKSFDNFLKYLKKEEKNFEVIEKTKNGYFRTYEALPGTYREIKYPEQFMQNCKNEVIKTLNTMEYDCIKTQIQLNIKFKKNNEEMPYDNNFMSFNFWFSKGDMIENSIKEAYSKILESIDKFVQNGSDLKISKVNYMRLHVAKYEPYKGGSYLPTPKEIANKKAIINVKNKDEKCFIWAILSAMYTPNTHPEIVSKYFKYESELNMEGIEYPVSISDISKFETNNNIGINLYSYDIKTEYKDKKKITSYITYPVRCTKKKYDKIIDLYLIYDGKGKIENGKIVDLKYHYCWVKNLDRLVSSQISKSKKKMYVCRFCLNHFYDETKYTNHTENCLDIQNGQYKHIIMPKEEDKILKFNNYNKTKKVQYVIYADFESILTEYIEDNIKNTRKIKKHIISGFALICVDSNNKVVFVNNQRIENDDDNMIDKLMITLDNWKSRIFDINRRNIDFDERQQIPVIFHNLRGYDAQLIFSGLSKSFSNRNIRIIPTSSEKFMSFTIDKFRFIDSFQFMATSLDNLAKNLKIDDFKVIKHIFDISFKGKDNTNNYYYATKKMIYPYDYMDSISKFSETKLPDKDNYKDSISMREISDEDYKYCQKIWEVFNIKNLGQLQDLYVMSDTAILADIFENFRKISLEYYGLDPAHYMSAPGLGWDAALKMTGIELELLTDQNMHIFFERQIRGGISIVSKRQVKANNIYMLDDYNPDKESSYIFKGDVNALYSTAMQDKLPVSNFRWASDKEVKDFNIDEFYEDGDIGATLEVDLTYPENLHNLHNDIPLAPENRYIDYTMLSKYCKSFNPGIKDRSKKLTTTFYDKIKYVIDIRTLKYYIKHGLEVTKIHNIVFYKQKAWLKKYIDFNTEKRTNSNSDFEKNFWKLMNNAVFGKSMENVRNRLEVGVYTESQAVKQIAKPNVDSWYIMGENMLQMRFRKTNILLNKPIYTGAAILDLSKILFYKFIYDYIKPKYGTKARFCYGDTDSYVIEIKTNDFYKDISNDILKIFDTSDNPKDHPLYTNVNKKKPGMIKDESYGSIITEFIGLRAKMYSILSQDKIFSGGNSYRESKGKGVQKILFNDNYNDIENRIEHDDYKFILESKSSIIRTNRGIRSFKHHLYSIEVDKLALSAYDDKRYLLHDGIDTLAYGHYKIREIEATDELIDIDI